VIEASNQLRDGAFIVKWQRYRHQTWEDFEPIDSVGGWQELLLALRYVDFGPHTLLILKPGRRLQPRTHDKNLPHPHRSSRNGT
jgi:hypothetical protein